LAPLHECLSVLTRLLAPFIPVVTEAVWSALYVPTGEVDSVHLAAWPAADPTLIDTELGEQVALVRRLVELGRAARAESKVKTRQPLQAAYVSAPGWDRLPPALRAEVADELNVTAATRLADAGELIDVSVKANFRSLGRRFGARTKQVADAIGAADPHALLAAVRDGGSYSLPIAGETVSVGPEEVIVTETPRSGWAVASAGAETVALDLELTHELRLAGLLRDVVRVVQEARKNAGLEVSDRIELWWQVGGSPEPAEAIRTHSEQLGSEVLATALHDGPPDDAAGTHESREPSLGLHIWLRRAR
jgi:isoleucyl-tRNA synthetase